MKPGIIVALIAAVFIAVFFYKKRGKQIKEAFVHRTGWMFGPFDNKGKNYSPDMPSRPTMQGGGWYFDFTAEVDAVVNYSPQPLRSPMTMRYAVEGGGFQATDGGDARVGLVLQRKGDNWSGKGKYAQYRLYSQSRPKLIAGEGQVIANAWIDINGKVVEQAVVDAVLADLDNYGVCFGGTTASHGVRATGPARFTFRGLDTA